MWRYVYISLAWCVCLLAAAAAAQPNLPVRVCPGGLQPDGYIDWSGLPTPPTLTPGTPSAPVTATLPVVGVPGLTVTVTIPSLTPTLQGSVPAWTVLGDSLRLNATDPHGTTTLGLSFSVPVNGVGGVMSAPPEGNSRQFSASISSAGSSSLFSSIPPFTGMSLEAPLQLRASGPAFQQVDLTLNGSAGEFGFSQVTWSNVGIESGTAPDPALATPKDGLVLWLAGDRGTNSNTFWQDLSSFSPTGNATGIAATAPAAYILDGPNCNPTYFFQGNQFLNFNRTIDGWQQMTILLVAKADQTPPNLYNPENAAIFWQENQPWGNTYLSPYPGYVTWRFGTTQTNTDHVYIRPKTVGGRYSITMAVHDRDDESLWINGAKVQQVDGARTELRGTTGDALLGEGLFDTPYNGKIAEVMVWNRVLTSAERSAVINYLKQKYGIY